MRIIHEDVYYSYEIYRSLKQLGHLGYVIKKSHNKYELPSEGEYILSRYMKELREEVERLNMLI